MRMSPRAAWALGLGLLGAAGLVAPGLAGDDGRTKGAATAAATPGPSVIGTVDVEAVLKGYEKVKATSEQFKADVMAKNAELMKISASMKQLTEKMQTFQPTSTDYKKLEGDFTKLKANLEAEREQAQHDFQQRESDAFAGFYKEVQAMVAAVAKSKGFTHVVKVSNEPVTNGDPDGPIRYLSRAVVYSDPDTDITRTVIHNLNFRYNAQNPAASNSNAGAGAATPKRTAAAGPGGNPRGN